MYPDMFENGDFSLSLRNNTRPHVAYSRKTSFFARRHVHEKPAFSKIPLWRAFFKRCVFGDLFHRIRVDGSLNRRKKNPVLSQGNVYERMGHGYITSVTAKGECKHLSI